MSAVGIPSSSLLPFGSSAPPRHLFREKHHQGPSAGADRGITGVTRQAPNSRVFGQAEKTNQREALSLGEQRPQVGYEPWSRPRVWPPRQVLRGEAAGGLGVETRHSSHFTVHHGCGLGADNAGISRRYLSAGASLRAGARRSSWGRRVWRLHNRGQLLAGAGSTCTAVMLAPECSSLLWFGNERIWEGPRSSTKFSF